MTDFVDNIPKKVKRAIEKSGLTPEPQKYKYQEYMILCNSPHLYIKLEGSRFQHMTFGMFQETKEQLEQAMSQIKHFKHIESLACKYFGNYGPSEHSYNFPRHFPNLKSFTCTECNVLKIPKTWTSLAHLSISTPYPYNRKGFKIIKIPKELINLESIFLYFAFANSIPDTLTKLKELECECTTYVPTSIVSVLEKYKIHCNGFPVRNQKIRTNFESTDPISRIIYGGFVKYKKIMMFKRLSYNIKNYIMRF